MTNYKSLEAWKKSMELVKAVYAVCKNYPKAELFELTSQTKRAAVSAPANIAEGHGRRTGKDTIQFFYISRGSLYELETLLNIAFIIDILEEQQFEKLSGQVDECLRLLNGLINHFEKNHK
jgi:four helix bundle protein